MKLVEDWKQGYKWFSAQSMVFVNAFLVTWALLPQKFQDSIPIGAVIAIAAIILTAGTVGRFVDQKPKDNA